MTTANDRRFGAGANRLCGLAARMLGWLPEQFWQATPAELAAVLSPYAAAAERPLAREDLERLMERETCPIP